VLRVLLLAVLIIVWFSKLAFLKLLSPSRLVQHLHLEGRTDFSRGFCVVLLGLSEYYFICKSLGDVELEVRVDLHRVVAEPAHSLSCFLRLLPERGTVGDVSVAGTARAPRSTLPLLSTAPHGDHLEVATVGGLEFVVGHGSNRDFATHHLGLFEHRKILTGWHLLGFLLVLV